MNTLSRLFLRFAVIATASISHTIHSSSITYDSFSSFSADTGATSATGAIPNLGMIPTPKTLGAVTFNVGPSVNQFWLGTGNASQWSSRIPGHDIALGGPENLDVSFDSPVFAAGFEFVEPKLDPNVNAAFIESTFTVTLKNGATVIDSFQFSPPNDSFRFYGIWSSSAFDQLSIRETVGGAGNEFFGQFYTGAEPYSVPDTLPHTAFPAVLLALAHRSRTRSKSDQSNGQGAHQQPPPEPPENLPRKCYCVQC